VLLSDGDFRYYDINPDSELGGLPDTVSDNWLDILALSDDVDELITEVDALNDFTDNLDTRVTALEDYITGDLADWLDDLSDVVDGHADDLLALQARMDAATISAYCVGGDITVTLDL
jgi:hypothetical protein